MGHYGISTGKLVGIGEIGRKSGSNFDDFLKEEGIFEEVTALAQKELAISRYEAPLEPDDTSEFPNNLRSRIRRFFRRIRHVMNL